MSNRIDYRRVSAKAGMLNSTEQRLVNAATEGGIEVVERGRLRFP